MISGELGGGYGLSALGKQFLNFALSDKLLNKLFLLRILNVLF